MRIVRLERCCLLGTCCSERTGEWPTSYQTSSLNTWKEFGLLILENRTLFSSPSLLWRWNWDEKVNQRNPVDYITKSNYVNFSQMALCTRYTEEGADLKIDKLPLYSPLVTKRPLKICLQRTPSNDSRQYWHAVPLNMDDLLENWSSVPAETFSNT